MNNAWHAQIQRYMNGQAGAEEVAALQAALQADAGLRALYLDYMNLDAALAAAAGAAPSVELEPGGLDASPLSPAQPSPHYWRWFAAAAAVCVAAVMVDLLLGQHRSVRSRPDVAAACSLTQEAIARLAVKPPPAIPAWTSPTDSLLEQPPVPKGDQRS
jgi:hypothetical protein